MLAPAEVAAGQLGRHYLQRYFLLIAFRCYLAANPVQVRAKHHQLQRRCTWATNAVVKRRYLFSDLLSKRLLVPQTMFSRKPAQLSFLHAGAGCANIRAVVCGPCRAAFLIVWLVAGDCPLNLCGVWHASAEVDRFGDFAGSMCSFRIQLPFVCTAQGAMALHSFGYGMLGHSIYTAAQNSFRRPK